MSVLDRAVAHANGDGGQARRDQRRHRWDTNDFEIPTSEARRLVRRIVAVIGRHVADGMTVEPDGEDRSVADDEERVAHAKMTAATVTRDELSRIDEERLRAGEPPLSADLAEELFDQTQAHVFGLMEADHWWRHPDLEDLDANGFDNVSVVFRGGRRVDVGPIGEHDRDVIQIGQHAGRRLGFGERMFDASHLTLDLSLADGSRFFAVYGGDRTNGVGARPYLRLRRHRHLDIGPDDLTRMGVIPEPVKTLLVAWIVAGGSLIIGGDQKAGKTTMLRALAGAIPKWESVVTIEALILELGLHRRGGPLNYVAALHSRPASGEGLGEVTTAWVTEKVSRRMSADRIVFGEILGSEVGPALDAMSSSSRGTMFTLHASSSQAVPTRLEEYGLHCTPPIPEKLVHHALAHARPLIVHLVHDVSVEGEVRRFATSLREVTGIEGDRVTTTELWGENDEHPGELVPLARPSLEACRRLARRGWRWNEHGWGDKIGDHR